MDMFFLNLVSGCFATLFMTGFSYILAHATDENFREPELLNMLLFPKMKPRAHRYYWKGWAIHFGIGIVFVSLFNVLWFFDLFPVSWFNAGAFGAGAGIVAIGGWYAFIKYSAARPPVTLKWFYAQLVMAHILFGWADGAIYNLWGIF